MKKIFMLGALVFLNTINALAQITFAKDAAKHIGEFADVRGRLYGTTVVPDPAHPGQKLGLAFVGGGNYPNQDVTYILTNINGYENILSHFKERDLTKVRDSLRWKTYVSAHGKLILYRGKPAIEIPYSEWGFLEFFDNGASPAALKNLQ